MAFSVASVGVSSVEAIDGFNFNEGMMTALENLTGNEAYGALSQLAQGSLDTAIAAASVPNAELTNLTNVTGLPGGPALDGPSQGHS